MSHLIIPKSKISTPTNVVWMPQERQRLFMMRPEYEALYGGAAGGGKSDVALAEMLRQVHIPHYRAITFRKTFPECAELIDRSHEIYPRAFPGARYNDNKHFWKFPSGAKAYFGSMQHRKDRTKHQGKRYDYIGFDELTHFTWDEYSYMFSRNRPGGPGTRVYIRGYTNPGGVGHSWVKTRFKIGELTPMTTIKDRLEIAGEVYNRSRVFIPSSVFDNKILLANDPNYIANLGMLPEAELNALLYGDWNSFSGQVFSEWSNDPLHYQDRRWTHVIEDINPIPEHWRIFRSFDFGYAKPFSVGWWAVDHDGRVYRIKDLYGCTGQPNTGVKWTPQKIAEQIKEIEGKYFKRRTIVGYADPAIWQKTTGESIAEMMERCGVYWEKGDNERIAGKMQYHYRMAFDADGLPMMYVFKSCKDYIRCLPNLVYDQLDVEDIDTSQEDHNYDEGRYFLMSRPIAPRRNVKAKPIQFDPLSIPEPVNRYGFMNM